MPWHISETPQVKKPTQDGNHPDYSEKKHEKPCYYYYYVVVTLQHFHVCGSVSKYYLLGLDFDFSL